MDVLVYKATYRMDNTYAEGYIILNNNFVEGVFANDYMAIYMENNNKTIAQLRALDITILANHSYIFRYVPYEFRMCGNILVPGQTHIFFSNNSYNDLYLYISEEVVDDTYSFYLAEVLLPKIKDFSL